MINSVFNDGLIQKSTPNRRSTQVVKNPYGTLLVSDLNFPPPIQGTITEYRPQLSARNLVSVMREKSIL